MDYSKFNEESFRVLRKKLLLFVGTTIFFLILSVVLLIVLLTQTKCSQWDTIPSESIIPVTNEIAVNNIAEGSAAYYRRSADVSKSVYYPIINFYDGKVTDILFKYYQNFKLINNHLLFHVEMLVH